MSGTGCLPDTGWNLAYSLEKTEELHIWKSWTSSWRGRNGLRGPCSCTLEGQSVEMEWRREREVHRRVEAGANAWKAVEGVMADRRISKILKGKVMNLYGMKTLALTEKQQNGCRCAKTTGYEI